MKIFFISAMLLAVTLMGILFNCLYINNVGTDLKEQVAALPSPERAGTAEAILGVEALQCRWSELRRIALFTSHRLLIDRVDEQISRLCSAAQGGDSEAYRTAALLLSDSLDAFLHPESLRGVL